MIQHELMEGELEWRDTVPCLPDQLLQTVVSQADEELRRRARKGGSPRFGFETVHGVVVTESFTQWRRFVMVGEEELKLRSEGPDIDDGGSYTNIQAEDGVWLKANAKGGVFRLRSDNV